MTRNVTIGALFIILASLLVEEAVIGLLKSMMPAEISNAMLSKPVLLTIAILLQVTATLLLWSVARHVSQQSQNSREVTRRAWESTESFAALEERHNRALETVQAQQGKLTALIEDAIAELALISSERERNIQEFKVDASKHLHAAALVAGEPIKKELEEWKRGVLKAIGEEFDYRCPKSDPKSSN